LNTEKDENKNVESWRLVNLVRQRLACLSQFGVTDLPRTEETRFPDWTAPLTSGPLERSGQPPLDRQSNSHDAVGSEQSTAEINESQVREQVVVTKGPDSSLADGSTKDSLLHLEYPYSPGGAERRSTMDELVAQFNGCPRCNEISGYGKTDQVVLGFGSMTPKICFLGEGRGGIGGESGKPFSGEAGQLLDKIIEACGFAADDVYVLNTVCRPPEDKNLSDLDSEILCWSYAIRQLEILQPEFVCCLGSVASRTLLETSASIGRLRQRFHRYRGSQVIATYHPAYLLRNPDVKKLVWDDMKMLIKAIGI